MKYFVLLNSSGSSHETAFVPLEPQFKEGLTCPACGRALTEKEWIPPLRAELFARGEGLGDVAFGPGLDLLVSERFLEAWRAEKLSGLHGLKEVEIRKVHPESAAHSRYHLALAGYGMTQIDPKRSRVVREGESDCLQCMGGAEVTLVEGFTIDEPTWSGEDVFVPWGFGGCLVATERVLAMRDKYGLSNVTLVPTEAFVWTRA
ncbi:hypothetical protein [Polyangium jinanense]|uniref:Uncharacterized protein n=1 Tax=Polyangium jinanense TaxID=2829994 RepID=A0A9X3WXS5_9BACT|nr:hypothetical protein [Polyangium jinanense]MDC3952658.1 hypothetical protein [Polyangium jinanense]MDC3980277.1 hypothetical protein [Polyangium jinanense]